MRERERDAMCVYALLSKNLLSHTYKVTQQVAIVYSASKLRGPQLVF